MEVEVNVFALLVECDPGTTLGGSCFRDVQNMANHLITRCNVSPGNVIVTTTAPINKSKQIDNVMYHRTATFFNSFKQLLSNCESGKGKILVLLSGHGYNTPDRSGDEKDGRDEAIQTGAGMVIDDNINDNIVKPAKGKGVKLILFSDTCHSGTMFDLPKILTNQQIEVDEFNIYSISACSDNQLSMCDVGDTTGFGGSLTTAILNLEGVLEDLITSNPDKVKKAHTKINKQLQKLNQCVVLSID